jgi:cobalt-zinc-cadmium efflux system outer membrane protein
VAELALGRIRLEVAETQWRSSQALAAQIERAVELEESAARDLLLARSESLEHRFHYLEALEETRHAEGTYSLLTGLSVWPGDWSETTADPAVFLDHPLLRLAQAEAARADGELRSRVGDQWGNPVLEIGTQHERDESGAPFSDRIVAGVRIPIGRRNDARADVAAARRSVAEARQQRQRLDRELRGRLAQAQHRLSLREERVKTAEERARMAHEYLLLTERGFALGESDLATLLQARQRRTAAEQVYQEALILRRFGAAELNQALGVVP